MAVNNHLMDNWMFMLKVFQMKICLLWTSQRVDAWLEISMDQNLCMIPFSKSFLISNGPFSFGSSLIPITDSVLFLFYSNPGFYSLQSLPLSFRKNYSNISSRSLQKIFFCLKSLYTDNHSVSSSSLFLPLTINSFPGIIQITIISWSFFSLNREEELFVDPS